MTPDEVAARIEALVRESLKMWMDSDGVVPPRLVEETIDGLFSILGPVDLMAKDGGRRLVIRVAQDSAAEHPPGDGPQDRRPG